jgi:methylated-DNA-protein-cysteine methyltransferase-like protein
MTPIAPSSGNASFARRKPREYCSSRGSNLVRSLKPPENQRWSDHGSFPSQVYAIVRRVPRGRVITYGAIASVLGDPRKARQVGWAMAAAHAEKPRIPAHRVINARGELSGGPAFGGYEVQRKKLEAEGVVFEQDGRVDLERYLWVPKLGR